MVVRNVVVVLVVVMVGGPKFRGGGPLQFFLEPLFDLRVFAIGFDLLDLKRYSETLGKVALSHREIARSYRAGVEVLVVPEVWRRNQRAGFPIDLHRIRLLEAVFAGQ